ncbi:hypothetical protein [Carboxylicivirga sp. N1Y90]|nr:hypothetical protein [Marinilabiliaceae bacterium N1Y90]
MPKKKCKEKSEDCVPCVKETHLYECKKCGWGAKKEGRLCKAKKVDKAQ